MEKKDNKALYEPKENKMGIMPVPKLLITMAAPMIFSMLVQALYNVVDSFFVSRVHEDALTALSLAFPIQNLMIAVSTGTGVGVNAMLSKSLGEGNRENVNKAAKNGIFLAICSYVLFLLFGIFGTRPFMESQTDSVRIIEYGVQYLTICSVACLGIYIQIIFERLLQGTGKTFITMWTQLTGAIINIVLDPILIFGFFGLPALGVAGAAIATVAGQIVAAIVAIICNLKFNKEIDFSFKGFRPDIKAIGRIYAVGFPSILMVAISSIMTYTMNKILIGFTTTAVAVFGAYFKLQSFVFMPIFGLNNGMIPIVAYNYGARKRSRVTGTIKLSVAFAEAMMAVGVLIFQFFGKGLLISGFDASETMVALGVPALRIISLHFLLAGFCIISSSVFQALGNGVFSLLISFARQLLVLLPAAYLLSLSGRVEMVWWSFLIAEFASLVLCSVFLRVTYNKKLKMLDA
ncbi:MAG: MATE family efflux transporter [Oscillospiraceae bacterium]|nr:MATE family efflux transporter [Oscillospiraceae bacterium]